VRLSRNEGTGKEEETKKKKKEKKLTSRINGTTSDSCLKHLQYLLNLKNRRICWRKVFYVQVLLGVLYRVVSPFVLSFFLSVLSSLSYFSKLLLFLRHGLCYDEIPERHLENGGWEGERKK